MLVLSRKPGEIVVIGEGPDAIRVMVTSIRGDQVRLGIAAPRGMRIDREEVHEARTERDGRHDAEAST